MKRIIDIPDELYKKIMGHRALTKYQEHLDYEDLKNLVEDSTPLTERTSEQSDKRTCTTCRNQGSHHGVCDICHDYSCWTAKEVECKAEDCISREATKQAIRDFFPNLDDRCEINSVINMQPSVHPKSNNSVLDDIKTEIESINDWDIRYAPTEDKDKRAQIVAKVKKHIISIVDKHISGKETE